MFFRALFAVSVLALTAACSGGSAGFPQIANPPGFDYADGAELRSRMHQLAFQLQQLDMALASQEERNAGLRDEVISSLRNIERIGNELRDGDLSTTHTFLQRDMANFLTTVSRAQMGAEANPPRYYYAGRVSGSCVNCHQVNQ